MSGVIAQGIGISEAAARAQFEPRRSVYTRVAAIGNPTLDVPIFPAGTVQGLYRVFSVKVRARVDAAGSADVNATTLDQTIFVNGAGVASLIGGTNGGNHGTLTQGDITPQVVSGVYVVRFVAPTTGSPIEQTLYVTISPVTPEI